MQDDYWAELLTRAKGRDVQDKNEANRELLGDLVFALKENRLDILNDFPGVREHVAEILQAALRQEDPKKVADSLGIKKPANRSQGSIAKKNQSLHKACKAWYRAEYERTGEQPSPGEWRKTGCYTNNGDAPSKNTVENWCEDFWHNDLIVRTIREKHDRKARIKQLST